MITTLISLLVIFLVLKVATDLGYIEHNTFLWHSADAATRGILFFYASIQMFGFTEKAYSTAIFFLWLYWVLFDFALNKARKLSWFYLGSGTTDNIVKWVGYKIKFPAMFLMLVVKLFVGLVSIIYLIRAF